MIIAGNATVYVSDMDSAVRFYTETLGLKLRQRYGNEWAEVEVGEGFVIGLHPASDRGPRPGTSGATQIGLQVSGDLDDFVQELEQRGVVFSGPIVDDEAVRLAFLSDPDGNCLYLCEVKWAAQKS